MEEIEEIKEFIEGFFVAQRLIEDSLIDRKFKMKNNLVILEEKGKYHNTNRILFCEFSILFDKIIIGFPSINRDTKLSTDIYLYSDKKGIGIRKPYTNLLEVKLNTVEELKEFFIEIVSDYF